MNKSRSSVIVAICLILFLSCKKDIGKIPAVSFCYWKTTFAIDSADAASMNQLGVQHLYLRLFDVDWDAITQAPNPVAECEKSYDYQYLTDITPTVFITNAVFENIKDGDLEAFAVKLSAKANALRKSIFESCLNSSVAGSKEYQNLINNGETGWEAARKYQDSVMSILEPEYLKRNNELLIDCDWTPSTKTKYFKFLELLKSKTSEMSVSSTLRLWQYRDYKLAGVPPVERCLLMCYNLRDPRKYETENSIATLDDLKSYINHSDYPLQLDVALPIHTWAVYFRKGRFKGIVNSIPVSEIIKNKALFEPKTDNRYTVLKDTVIGETYYRFGDVFRIEQVDLTTLNGFALHLKQYLKKNHSTRISFFSWDAQFYNRFKKDEYNQIIHNFAE
jgi:hypothetical protein